MPLDKTRPYAEVFGPSDHRFIQDDILYDALGNELSNSRSEFNAHGNITPIKNKPGRKAKDKTPAPELPPVDAAIEDQINAASAS